MIELLESFCRNADGSWACVRPATVQGPNGRIQVAPGSTFWPGRIFMGVDLARWLEDVIGANARNCPG